MKCENCVYCYKGDDDRYPRCHWTDEHGEDSLYGTPWDIAPCEEFEGVRLYEHIEMVERSE